MSSDAAVAFLNRVEQDEAFAGELKLVRTDRIAVLAKVHAAGFDVTEDELLHAFVDRYGAELTPEQLDAIAAGNLEADMIILAVALGGVAAAAAAT
jgi:predicted ribosomally synthesized peptide with nif11-like leader